MGRPFCKALTRRHTPRSATARHSRRPTPTLAYLTSDVPPNVRDAREWIAAWKASRLIDENAHLRSATEAPVVVPNVPDAHNLIAAFEAHPVSQAATPEPAAKVPFLEPVSVVPHGLPDQVPMPVVQADGTTIFSKKFLDTFSYEDMLAKLPHQAQ